MTRGWKKLERQQEGGGLTLILKYSWWEVTGGGDRMDTRLETGLGKAV